MELLDSLIDSFTSEAIAAPKLFADLSKVEEYIAETYKNRSFIELIQNADDAISTSFGIHQTSFGFVVCNNGRAFNDKDLETLCRSGSSNKQRGGTTIGYRGIGFKSVVGLAKQIILLSGDFQICFDKIKTQQLLHVNNAPTIRIPHKTNLLSTQYQNEINSLKLKYGYTTIFAFVDVNMEVLNSEISRFDYSCLLFLNHILNVNIETEQKTSFIRLDRKEGNDNQVKIEAQENDCIIAEWILFRSEQSAKDIVAFKFKDNSIIPAIGSESVIHSFMPSIEFTGAFIKINGDFSTDPSRKSIDIDVHSNNAIENCAHIVAHLIINVLLEKQDIKGLFSPFIDTFTETQSFAGKIFTKQIVALLQSSKKLNIEKFRLCPKWLPYEDFELLGANNFNKVSKEFVTSYPESVSYLENLGVQTLSLKETLKYVNGTKLSNIGATQIISKIISQYYFDMTAENVSFLKGLTLFPIKDKPGLYSVCDFSKLSDLDDNCLKLIIDENEYSELSSFFKKFGIELPKESTETPPEMDKIAFNDTTLLSSPTNRSTLFIKTPQIQHWRSSEQNLIEYLKCLQDVERAIDVASANLGYDIEVVFNNGKRIYIEVKSVSYFGEPFKMTNNEYSTAHNYQDQYYLALVVNGTEFQVMFIHNPILNIKLDKQCERWSWVCNNVENKIISTEDLIKNNIN